MIDFSIKRVMRQLYVNELFRVDAEHLLPVLYGPVPSISLFKIFVKDTQRDA